MRNFDLKKFWDENANQFGHTGYQNPILYAYDQPLRLKLLKKLIRTNLVGKDKLKCALEIGCGSGDFVQLLLNQGFEQIDAVDVSKSIISNATDRFNGEKKVRLYQGDIFDFPGQPGFYDLIICITVLQHVVDNREWIRTIERIHQLLKPNGVFISLDRVSTNGRDEYYKQYDFCYLSVRTPNQIERAYKLCGFHDVAEGVLPQLAVSLNYYLHTLISNIFDNSNRGVKDLGNDISGKFSKKFFKRLIQSIMMIFCRPSDHWLSLPIPAKKFRNYRCYVSKKY